MDLYDRLVNEADADDMSTKHVPRNPGRTQDPDGLRKRLWGELWDGCKVFTVSEEHVRNHLDTDFAGGGHTLAYPDVIPEWEIWVAEENEDKAEVFEHEVEEYTLMRYAKLTYSDAHDASNSVEAVMRSFLRKEVKEDEGAIQGDGELRDVRAMRQGAQDPAKPATDIPMQAQQRLEPEKPQEPQQMRDFWMGIPPDHKQELIDYYNAKYGKNQKMAVQPAPTPPPDYPSIGYEEERTLHGLLIREVP